MPSGEGVHAVYAGLDLEIEDGGGDHGRSDDDDADDREPGDDAGDKLPEPLPGGVGECDSCLAEEGDGQVVDSRAKERKGGRQKGEGGHQGNQYDQYRANGKGLEKGEGNDEDAAEGDDDGDAAEEHCAARGCAGALYSRVLVQAAGQLAPVAGYYDEGIVDSHGQPDHDDHQRDEEYQLEDLPYECRQAQRGDDADDGQPYGHQGGGDGAEEDHEDDEGDRDAEAFSPLQVVFRQLVVVVGGAGVPYHKYVEAVLAVRFHDNAKDVLDVFRGLLEVADHDKGHYRGLAVGGHQRRVVFLIIAPPPRHCAAPQQDDCVIDRSGHFLKYRIIHRTGVRLNDNDFGYCFGTPKPIFQ